MKRVTQRRTGLIRPRREFGNRPPAVPRVISWSEVRAARRLGDRIGAVARRQAAVARRAITKLARLGSSTTMTGPIGRSAIPRVISWAEVRAARRLGHRIGVVARREAAVARRAIRLRTRFSGRDRFPARAGS